MKPNDIYISFAKSYHELGMTASDFNIPTQIFSRLDEADILQSHLTPDKLKQFQMDIFDAVTQKKRNHMEHIEYLKRQLVINELRSELSTVEDMFHKMQDQLPPKAKKILIDRITEIKNEIEKKAN